MGITPLFALVAPYILWPIEYYLPYPFVFEELAKGVFVYLIIVNKDIKNKTLTVVVSALLFSISESVLYLFNIFQLGGINTLLMRFVFTTPMHIITALIIYVFGKKDKRLIPFGVIISGVVHLLYNATILTLGL